MAAEVGLSARAGPNCFTEASATTETLSGAATRGCGAAGGAVATACASWASECVLHARPSSYCQDLIRFTSSPQMTQVKRSSLSFFAIFISLLGVVGDIIAHYQSVFKFLC